MAYTCLRSRGEAALSGPCRSHEIPVSAPIVPWSRGGFDGVGMPVIERPYFLDQREVRGRLCGRCREALRVLPSPERAA
jgi:hypothetical protein